MENPLSLEEQDYRLLASLPQEEARIAQKEQQNTQLATLLAEKKQLVLRLESFLREVEQESIRIDQAIAKTRELAAH
jgi:hypothetical protein